MLPRAKAPSLASTGTASVLRGLVGFSVLAAWRLALTLAHRRKRKFPLCCLLLLLGAEGKPRSAWVLSHWLPGLHNPRTRSCAHCVPVSPVGRVSSSSRKVLWGGGGGAVTRNRLCHRSGAECSLYFLSSSSTGKNEILVKCSG